MMRDTVHSMVEQHEPGLKTLSKDDWWAFEMFLSYWLSALFVLVEGFNKKLTDTRVQKLFKEHVRHLKMVRHATYHLVLEFGKPINFVGLYFIDEENATKPVRSSLYYVMSVRPWLQNE
jgi:hypothetical protein